MRRFAPYLALVLFGLAAGVAVLELGLRSAAWMLTRTRAPVRLGTERVPGTIRVLCLGESTTFDVGLSGQDSYPAQLERLLNARPGNRHRWVVVNGGVPATSSDRIVAALKRNLDEHLPDVVVTMMGINDGLADDPMYSTASDWRVVKLVRLLAASLRGVPAAAPGPPPAEIAAIPRRPDQSIDTSVPMETALALRAASEHLLQRRLDAAERLLLPIANAAGDDPATRYATVEAVEKLLLLSQQRGDGAAVAQHRRRHAALLAGWRNPKTATNYAILAHTVAARGLVLVAVQYPGLPMAPLRAMLPDVERVVFVDNEETFLRAASTRPLADLYRDLFRGLVGHLTPEGNRLLAGNVAEALAQVAEAAAPQTP